MIGKREKLVGRLEEISSSAEAAADYAKSDRPLARAATGNNAMHLVKRS